MHKLNTKEDLLKEMKEMVDAVSNNIVLPDLKARWLEVIRAQKELNSCDAIWLQDEYTKWHNQVITPKSKAKAKKS